jgi:hypothetical protein
VLAEPVGSPGVPESLRDRCESALVRAKLKPDLIKSTFLLPFGISPKKLEYPPRRRRREQPEQVGELLTGFLREYA